MLELTLDLLKQEMATAGFSKSDISKWYHWIKIRIEDISSMDVEMLDIRHMGEEYDLSQGLEGVLSPSHPPSATFDSHTNVHSLYLSLSARALQLIGSNFRRSVEPLPSLKKMLVTKRNYKKQMKC